MRRVLYIYIQIVIHAQAPTTMNAESTPVDALKYTNTAWKNSLTLLLSDIHLFITKYTTGLTRDIFLLWFTQFSSVSQLAFVSLLVEERLPWPTKKEHTKIATTSHTKCQCKEVYDQMPRPFQERLPLHVVKKCLTDSSIMTKYTYNDTYTSSGNGSRTEDNIHNTSHTPHSNRTTTCTNFKTSYTSSMPCTQMPFIAVYTRAGLQTYVNHVDQTAESERRKPTASDDQVPYDPNDMPLLQYPRRILAAWFHFANVSLTSSWNRFNHPSYVHSTQTTDSRYTTYTKSAGTRLQSPVSYNVSVVDVYQNRHCLLKLVRHMDLYEWYIVYYFKRLFNKYQLEQFFHITYEQHKSHARPKDYLRNIQSFYTLSQIPDHLQENYFHRANLGRLSRISREWYSTQHIETINFESSIVQPNFSGLRVCITKTLDGNYVVTNATGNRCDGIVHNILRPFTQKTANIPGFCAEFIIVAYNYRTNLYLHSQQLHYCMRATNSFDSVKYITSHFVLIDLFMWNGVNLLVHTYKERYTLAEQFIQYVNQKQASTCTLPQLNVQCRTGVTLQQSDNATATPLLRKVPLSTTDGRVSSVHHDTPSEKVVQLAQRILHQYADVHQRTSKSHISETENVNVHRNIPERLRWAHRILRKHSVTKSTRNKVQCNNNQVQSTEALEHNSSGDKKNTDTYTNHMSNIAKGHSRLHKTYEDIQYQNQYYTHIQAIQKTQVTTEPVVKMTSTEPRLDDTSTQPAHAPLSGMQNDAQDLNSVNDQRKRSTTRTAHNTEHAKLVLCPVLINSQSIKEYQSQYYNEILLRRPHFNGIVVKNATDTHKPQYIQHYRFVPVFKHLYHNIPLPTDFYTTHELYAVCYKSVNDIASVHINDMQQQCNIPSSTLNAQVSSNTSNLPINNVKTESASAVKLIEPSALYLAVYHYNEFYTIGQYTSPLHFVISPKSPNLICNGQDVSEWCVVKVYINVKGCTSIPKRTTGISTQDGRSALTQKTNIAPGLADMQSRSNNIEIVYIEPKFHLSLMDVNTLKQIEMIFSSAVNLP